MPPKPRGALFLQAGRFEHVQPGAHRKRRAVALEVEAGRAQQRPVHLAFQHALHRQLQARLLAKAVGRPGAEDRPKNPRVSHGERLVEHGRIASCVVRRRPARRRGLQHRREVVLTGSPVRAIPGCLEDGHDLDTGIGLGGEHAIGMHPAQWVQCSQGGQGPREPSRHPIEDRPVEPGVRDQAVGGKAEQRGQRVRDRKGIHDVGPLWG